MSDAPVRYVVPRDVRRGEASVPVDQAPARQRWVDKRRATAQERTTSRWRPGVLRGSTISANHAQGWEERHWSSRLLHRVGEIVAHSAAGIIAASFVMVWVVVGLIVRFPSWWEVVLYSVTSSVTFVMVFVIQHTQERQTYATQRKLDELIRSSAHADNTLIAVEEAADEHLQALTELNLADREAAANPSDRD